MAYRYESSHFEAEIENEAFSYNSMGHMGHNGHNNHLGFGNGMRHHQIGGCSNYGQANSGYGMGHQLELRHHHGMGHQLGMGHHHGNGFHHGGGGQMASGYVMSQESNYYSSHNSYNPCKKFF